MTNELKTLKDIDFVDCGRFVSDSLVRKRLRQETIKWIKAIEGCIVMNCNFPSKSGIRTLVEKAVGPFGYTPEHSVIFLNDEVLEKKSCIGILKHISNISEEDLK